MARAGVGLTRAMVDLTRAVMVSTRAAVVVIRATVGSTRAVMVLTRATAVVTRAGMALTRAIADLTRVGMVLAWAAAGSTRAATFEEMQPTVRSQRKERLNLKKMVVNTEIANLWTSPASPRTLDGPVMTDPIELEKWLEAMNYKEREALCANNLVQSQVLYGTELEVLCEQDEWVQVIVSEQPSSKDVRGYPGWIVKRQLRQVSAESNSKTLVVVNRPTAFIYDDSLKEERKVSFQTRLSLVEELDDWVTVSTPSGIRRLRKNDVIQEPIVNGQENAGLEVVHAGEQFIGLPYLWGGMSGFGYDCSGFAHMMHRSIGCTIPRDASDQAKSGTVIERNELKPGDLLYFAHEQGKGAVHHVGIYHGDGKMIHAPKTGRTVEIIPLADSEYENEYFGARRYWGG